MKNTGKALPSTDDADLVAAIKESTTALNRIADEIAASRQYLAQAHIDRSPFDLVAGMTGSPLASMAQMSGSTSSTLTHAQIRAELSSFFGSTVQDANSLDYFVAGGPAKIVALYAKLNEWPAFAQRGLNLAPNDLRHVRTILDLTQIIAANLR